jgi:hypothetical protein
MLVPLLFGCGIVFLFLGITKQVGLKNFPEANEALSIAFYVYGFAHLAIALFLLNAPIPFGELEYTNTSDFVNVTYGYVNATANQSVDCNFTCIKEIPILNTSSELRFHEEHYVYSDSGQDLVNLFFQVDFIVLTAYIVLLVLGMFKKIIERKKPNEENDNASS